MSFQHMLLSMAPLQIRYLSLLMNITSHLARGQSAVQMYVTSALLQLLFGPRTRKKKGVILLEEDIFLTPSDHQKAEDVRGVVGRKQLLYQIHWVEM